jgi:starch synthase (maltosyl-transferring)
MLDLVINHTGWGSTLYEQHPEWFRRHADGRFESPGAWGTIWEDLVELDQRHVALWEQFAEAFLTWCRRGVDAFRCDAGYKIPLPVWQFITARVRQEFPETVFLLEGLGGSWEATNELLGEGGMQWAYSELFQNFGGQGVQWYLDYALATSRTAGTLIHYGETHDNARLAAHAQGRSWSLHRNLLSALTSVNGGYGFTNGVEWLATEQVNVHGSRGLAWGAEPNLLKQLGALNRLLAGHPCFYDGAKLTRLSPDGAAVYLLRRDSSEGLDSVLVFVNTDTGQPQTVRLETGLWSEFCGTEHDLLEPETPERKLVCGEATAAWVELELRPGAVHCLATSPKPRGIAGDTYRQARACADWALAAAARVGAEARFADADWRTLATEVDAGPAAILGRTLGAALDAYAPVIVWRLADRNRISLVPPGHWLLLHDDAPFRARLKGAGDLPENAESVPVKDGHVACFAPRHPASALDARLELERYGSGDQAVTASLRFLTAEPQLNPQAEIRHPQSLVLLTNGRGAMARLLLDLGSITSKYDCLLGANLNPAIPVDRHIFAKRARVWVNADGFITPLKFDNLVDFEPGPPAHWRFVVNAGDGRCVEVHLIADLLSDQNTVVLEFVHPNSGQRATRFGRTLSETCKVSLVVRVDIEDRSFHAETKRNDGADYHFSSNCRQICTRSIGDGQDSFNGFSFTPANDRRLRVWADAGEYHHQPEWSLNIPHPV